MIDPALLTTIIFALTYLGIAMGAVPGLRIDRAGIAWVGATLMLVTGMLGLEEAVGPGSVDYKTILLLLGMMVVIAFLRIARLFERCADLALWRIRSPLALLAVTVLLSGALSAFLINDIICLALTPLVIQVARELDFDPLPHVIALATASNIGSVATITGNPQNIYIGAHSGITYAWFAWRLAPVAIVGLLVDFVVIAMVYRRLLARPANPSQANTNLDKRRTNPALRGLRIKTGIVTLACVGLFFTGLPLELIALGAASVLLLGRVNPRKIYQRVDWSLLLLFGGLFIVVHALQVHVVGRWGVAQWNWLLDRPIALLSLVTAGISNLVSNVPAVLLLEPIVKAVPSPGNESAWLALAMSSTLAGNLTILGSVANLIVVENAKRAGVGISFWQYCKVGVPLTLMTLALGIAWLQFT